MNIAFPESGNTARGIIMRNKEVTTEVQVFSTQTNDTTFAADEGTPKESYWSAAVLSGLMDLSPTTLTPLDEW
jgi:hypothetical protein